MIDLQVEKYVIGAMIHSVNCIEYAINQLNTYDISNNILNHIYNTIIELYKKGKSIDVIVLSNSLNNDKKYLSLLTDCIESTPALSQFKEYCNILKDLSFRRSVNVAASMIIELTTKQLTQEELATQSEMILFKAIQREDILLWNTMPDITKSVSDRISNIICGMKGIKSYFNSLDKLIGWFERGEMIVIGASTSIGKSMLSGCMGLNIAKHGIPIGIFSLEMTKREYGSRWASSESGLNHVLITKYPQNMKPEESKLIENILDNLDNLPIYIDDTPNLSLSRLLSKIKAMKRKHKIEVVFIDHLGLIDHHTKYHNRNIDIGEITASLKGIAKELNIILIILSQLNRGVSERADKRPLLSDLRDSGNIEQDADKVMLLYRDEYYNVNTDKKGILDISIQKNRNGSTGHCELVFIGSTCTIKDFVN